MDIKPIRTEADYDWALSEISPYFDTVPEPGTAEADRFDILADLIAAYEAKHHPMEPLNPVEMIAAYMEERDLQQADLAQVVGSVSRASEFINRKRPLTLAAIQKINAAWKLPAEVLIQPYHLDRGSQSQEFSATG